MLNISDVEFINKARNNFLAVDESAHGEIEFHDLQSQLRLLGVEDKEIEKVFEKLDCDGNGSISYSEWVCALVFCDKHMITKNLPNLFKFLDVHKKGRLLIRDLEQAYKPHIFRLKLELGREELELHNLLQEVCQFDDQPDKTKRDN